MLSRIEQKRGCAGPSSGCAMVVAELYYPAGVRREAIWGTAVAAARGKYGRGQQQEQALLQL